MTNYLGAYIYIFFLSQIYHVGMFIPDERILYP